MRLRALWIAVIAVACQPGLAAATPSRPNIIVVLADQWRAQAFGFAGDANVKTPHLDRFAAESCRFINAVSGVPVCSPARASLLTGQRPLTHGVFINDVELNPNAVTLAKVLRDAGYATAVIGKWHINGDARSVFIPRERRQGFDYWKVLECTHQYNNSYYYADTDQKLKWEGYDAIAQTKDACAYVRQAAGGKPFLLWLAWGPPHDPYQTAPANYRAMYDPEKMVLRPNVPAAQAARARRDLAGYYAHCTALDDAFGELIETLRATGQADNTIVLFSSDHGDLLESQGASYKQRPWDESIRVPMLMRWPAGLGGKARELTAPINTEDVMPTLLGMAGVTIPASVEGRDYSGYLNGGKNPGDDAALMASIAPFADYGKIRGGREYRGIRTPRYTYVRDLKGPWLLYDNEADPYQLHNLVNEPAAARLQEELDARLRSKLRQEKDEFLASEQYLEKWGYKVRPDGAAPYTP